MDDRDRPRALRLPAVVACHVIAIGVALATCGDDDEHAFCVPGDPVDGGTPSGGEECYGRPADECLEPECRLEVG
ncbi:MAG: hypothetical protein IT379_33415 [Deltaproteobacteria bacterium]|nr:hypothetical protein [Deltaproteobacteria bacterium]